MAGFVDIFEAVFLPALIAALLYALLAYVLLPIYRAHRARYTQYLPLSNLSTHTTGLPTRFTTWLTNTLIPHSMRWRREVVYTGGRRGSSESYVFGEEEGESMVGFADPRRLERGRDERGGVVDVSSDRRLSRELEEGFKDDSSEGEGGGDEGRRRVGGDR